MLARKTLPSLNVFRMKWLLWSTLTFFLIVWLCSFRNIPASTAAVNQLVPISTLFPRLRCGDLEKCWCIWANLEGGSNIRWWLNRRQWPLNDFQALAMFTLPVAQKSSSLLHNLRDTAVKHLILFYIVSLLTTDPTSAQSTNLRDQREVNQ